MQRGWSHNKSAITIIIIIVLNEKHATSDISRIVHAQCDSPAFEDFHTQIDLRTILILMSFKKKFDGIFRQIYFHISAQ